MAQQGGNPIELYEAAAQGFRKTLSGVGLNQMGAPTPCTEWNVQALINHNLKVAAFVEGVYRENITVSPLDVGGPLPGGDALELLDAGIGNVLEVLKSVGSLDQKISSPFGEMTRAEFLMNPTWDLLVHTWDLAKGTSQSTTLDSHLVEICHNAFAPMMEHMREEEFGGVKIMGPEVQVPASASLQDRFLGVMGRQP